MRCEHHQHFPKWVYHKVDVDIEYTTPLLATGPENADSLAFRIDDSIEEVESHMEDFKLAHR